MASPYKKVSKMKKRSRGANWKLGVPSLTVCPTCQNPILPHHACPNCGNYKGREVVAIKTKKKKKKKEA